MTSWLCTIMYNDLIVMYTYVQWPHGYVYSCTMTSWLCTLMYNDLMVMYTHVQWPQLMYKHFSTKCDTLIIKYCQNENRITATILFYGMGTGQYWNELSLTEYFIVPNLCTFYSALRLNSGSCTCIELLSKQVILSHQTVTFSKTTPKDCDAV